SETGARLLASCPPPAGHDGFLSWEGNSCPCRIAWSGQDSFGVSFLMAEPAIHELASRASSPGSAAPAIPSVMIPLAPQSAPRSLLPPRPPLELPAEVSQGEAWIKVVLRGIAQNGFEVGWFPRCKDRARI